MPDKKEGGQGCPFCNRQFLLHSEFRTEPIDETITLKGKAVFVGEEFPKPPQEVIGFGEVYGVLTGYAIADVIIECPCGATGVIPQTLKIGTDFKVIREKRRENGKA